MSSKLSSVYVVDQHVLFSLFLLQKSSVVIQVHPSKDTWDTLLSLAVTLSVNHVRTLRKISIFHL